MTNKVSSLTWTRGKIWGKMVGGLSFALWNDNINRKKIAIGLFIGTVPEELLELNNNSRLVNKLGKLIHTSLNTYPPLFFNLHID